METFEFLCGGDHGAWECLVDVELSEEEIQFVREYSRKNAYLDCEFPVEDIYQEVYSGLVDQCISSYYEIGDMERIREDYAESEDETDEEVVEKVLKAQGFVIQIPSELRDSEY